MTIGDGQPAGVAGIIRRVRYRNEVQQHGLRVLQLLNGRVALDRLQPERGVDAHADRVRPLSGAPEEGCVRGSSALHREVGSGHVQLGRLLDVLARDGRQRLEEKSAASSVMPLADTVDQWPGRLKAQFRMRVASARLAAVMEPGLSSVTPMTE